MKRIFALILAWAVCTLPVCAQHPESGPASRTVVREEASANNPSALAMRESQRLQKAIGLNAKQTRKVYKLFYNHIRQETPQAPGFGGPQHHAGPGAPGMGGPGAPGMGRSGRGEMRPEGAKPGAMRPDAQMQRPDAGEMRQNAEAWQKKQAKKFRKIFTSEQYAAWEKLAARPSHPGGPAPEKPDGHPERP